jgi:SAM-dependent methyltransferase
VDARLIDLRGEPQISFTQHEAKRDLTRNLAPDAALAQVGDWLEAAYRSALLKTTGGDWQLHLPPKGQARLVRHKPSTTTPPPHTHDRAKHSALGENAHDWLAALGVFAENGRVRGTMVDKHRQITRYAEILSHLLRDCGWSAKPPADAPLLKVADMGAGRGYLTFAVWHLLHRVMRRKCVVLGIEARPDLVAGANRIVREVRAEGLEFLQGDIERVELERLDVLIALHACNTATDDAIRRGIDKGAKLIVVAPCCHQALRPELGDPEPFAAVLRHGLFKERLAEWLTDALRLLFLEWAGYQTKAIEFVGSEHTPKNLMLAAVRKHAPFSDAKARERIVELKRFFGIAHHALDPWLDPPC